MNRKNNNPVHYLAVFAAYTLIASVATWPLATQFTTHLAGGDYLSVWNLWWVKHSVIDLYTNPLYTDYMFYPYRVHLLMSDLCLLNGLLSIPIQMVTSLGVAYNLIFILSYPVGALGMYLLARHLTSDWRAAFVAGAAFGFLPFKTLHPSTGMIHWLPYALLYIIRMFEGAGDPGPKGNKADSPDGSRPFFQDPSTLDALLAGMFTGFAFLTEHHSLMLLGLFFLISAAYYAFMRQGGIMRQAMYFCLGCAPFIAPVLGFAVKEIMTGNIRAEWIAGPGANLLGLFSPPKANILLGWLTFVPGNTAYVGLGVIVMAVMGFWREWRTDPLVRLLGLCVLLFGALLPITLSAIPIIIALMSALLAYCIRGRQWRISAIALAVVLIEFLPMPFVTVSADIPEPYKIIAADKDAHAVLEIPFSVRDDIKKIGSSNDARILYYQTAHGKRMPNGYVRHLAPQKIFLSFLNFPVIRSLPYIDADMRPKLSVIEADKAIAPETLDLLGLDYVILHTGNNSWDEQSVARDTSVREYLSYVIQMKKIYEDPPITVFKTTRHEFNPMIIDLGNEEAIPYLMYNWINAQAELSTDFGWVAGDKAEMIVGLKKGERYTASFFMRPQKDMADPSVTIYLNDTLIGKAKLQPEWAEYSFSLPSYATNNGANRITFVPASTVLVPGDFRGPWTDASYFKTLRGRYIYDPSETRRPLDWEQDNARFEGMPISVAVDAVRITRKPKDRQ